MRRAGGPALWPRLWVLRRLLLVQSDDWRGSLGRPEDGAWFSLCLDPECPRAGSRCKVVAKNVPEECCGQERVFAEWEEDLVSDGVGRLTGLREFDVLVCVDCRYCVEGTEPGPDDTCPSCGTRLLKFGTPAED